ncbi:MAG: multiheme c-type cytochrome [Thermoguttaceae bacterium]
MRLPKIPIPNRPAPPGVAVRRRRDGLPLGVGRFLLGAAVWLAAVPPRPAGAADAYRQPVYVGVKVCAECHEGDAMGNQLTAWLHSRHAKAYTSLSRPEARQIARWSGIPMEPQESAMCLGCHATATEAEPWERDETFSIKEGVQCEKCHGAGSEYMDLEVMIDPKASRAAGLKMPTQEDCLNCHAEKGSHRIVLGPNSYDLEKAWQAIAHPTPKNWRNKHLKFPEPALSEGHEAAYTGVAVCAECHAGPAWGYQFSKWQGSPHADAYASLGTVRAKELAAEAGVQGDPRASAECLKCHATAYHRPGAEVLDSYSIHQGVSCEACHGPGSQHADEAASKSEGEALSVKLPEAGEQTCQPCHAKAHGKPFDYVAALAQIAHPKVPPAVEAEVRYKTPLNLALSPDGRELYATCEASNSVVVIDTNARRKVAEIPVGGQPMDVAFAPDGRRAFVSNRLDDSVSVIDVVGRKVVSTIAVGDEPHGVLTDREGKDLYVLNTATEDISVIDTATLAECRRLSASRGPWALAMSPDGSRILATSMLSRFVEPRMPSISEVTVIDTRRAVVVDRPTLPATNLLQGVAWHPSGKFALVTMLRTKNVVPMTRTLQGWTITNGLGIVWADGRTDQVLLDEPGMCFPDPVAVAITPDGKWALVTSATDDRVAVIDIQRLVDLVESASDEDRQRVLPNHLGKAGEFVLAQIPTLRSPRDLVIAADNRTAYVANALDDSISVIDLAELRLGPRIDLEGPRQTTEVRRGELLFHNAKITFHRQFSCHSCHPDGHVDGLTYDTEPDGIGVDPVDNKTLRGILDTAPFKWSGKNPSFSRQCGPRLSAFFTRLEPFTPEELAALDLYVCTIQRPPNRYRPVGAPLTEAQRRGKVVFERTRTNDGSTIPAENRCVTCHFPPLYTDRRLHDVGSKMEFDTMSKFDVPHLNNIYDSAPYLHNGAAATLEEIWTVYNRQDTHGVTNDMTKDQLNDLIEYLKTL